MPVVIRVDYRPMEGTIHHRQWPVFVTVANVVVLDLLVNHDVVHGHTVLLSHDVLSVRSDLLPVVSQNSLQLLVVVMLDNRYPLDRQVEIIVVPNPLSLSMDVVLDENSVIRQRSMNHDAFSLHQQFLAVALN